MHSSIISCSVEFDIFQSDITCQYGHTVYQTTCLSYDGKRGRCCNGCTCYGIVDIDQLIELLSGKGQYVIIFSICDSGSYGLVCNTGSGVQYAFVRV